MFPARRLMMASTVGDPPTVDVPSDVQDSTTTSITLTGTNFVSGNTTVTVDGTSATSVSVSSSTSLTCTVPSKTRGSYTLVLTTPYGSASTTIYYYAPPTITSITPNPAPRNPGQTFAISGTNFTARSGYNTEVFFYAGGSATSVTVNSSTSITATGPTLAGTDYVIVWNGDAWSNSYLLTVTAAVPTYSSISPTSGVNSTVVTITGTGFVNVQGGGTTVTIGGVSATEVIATSTTTLTCVVPTISTTGSKNVVITTNGGSVTGTGAFNYTGSTATKLTGVTYLNSSIYSPNNAPTYTYMNDGNANGSSNDNQTGTNSALNQWIRADCGANKFITRIIIGYDYLSNLVGGWGVRYTEGLSVQGSTDGSNWTSITTTPTYSSTGSTNGLVSIRIGGTWRYVRLTKSDYICTLEFQVWGY